VSTLAAFLGPLRRAARTLLRAPGFSVAVVATLVLVIGPGVALLSVVEQIFWRELPLPNAGELVVFQPPQGPFNGSSSQSSDFSVPLTYSDYRAFAEPEESPFSGVVARGRVGLALSWDGTTEEIEAAIVSGNYFDVLGVTPAAGRLLHADDDRVPRGHPVVVLSWAAWQRRFGGDPAVVGRAVDVNGQPMTVLGVAMHGFSSLEVGYAPELWIPMAMKAVATPLSDNLENRRSRWLSVVGRLKPGADRAAAAAWATRAFRASNLETLATFSPSEELRARYLEKKIDLLDGARGRSDLRGRFGDALKMLLGLVGLLFALACANLANLFLARSTRHERELTVRLAIGAGRGHLVAHLLAEAGLLATAAALLGTALALTLPAALPSLLPDDLAGIQPEASPLLIALVIALSLAATLGCGLLPALASTRGDLGDRLRRSGAGSIGGHGTTGQRRLLVGVQMALSVAILVGAGLLARSIAGLTERDPGYRVDRVLSFAVDPRLKGDSLEREKATVERIAEEIGALPGVTAVGHSEVPLLMDWRTTNSIEFPGRERGENDDWMARFDTASPGYFEALGFRLSEGRWPTAADRDPEAPVAVVSEEFARRYFPEGSAVGQRFTWGDRPQHEIVGVFGDIVAADLREEAPPFVYLSFAAEHHGSASFFYVRTSGDPTQLGDAVRRTVAGIDPHLPVTELRSLAAQRRVSLGIELQSAAIASALGLIAALLAAIGIYGVLAYAVDARRRELALRSALGAGPRALVTWVVGHATAPVAAGLVVGVALALAGGRLVGSLLYGIGPADPFTFASVSVALLGVAATATLVPARRAVETDPSSALRDE